MKKILTAILTILLLGSCSNDTSKTFDNTNEGILAEYQYYVEQNDFKNIAQKDEQYSILDLGDDNIIKNKYTADTFITKDGLGNRKVLQNVVSSDDMGLEEKTFYFLNNYLYVNFYEKYKYPITFEEFSQNLLLTSTLKFDINDISDSKVEKNDDGTKFTFYININAPYFNDVLGANKKLLSNFFKVGGDYIDLTATDVRYDIYFDNNNIIKSFEMSYEMNMKENEALNLSETNISLNCVTTIEALPDDYIIEFPDDLDTYPE